MEEFKVVRDSTLQQKFCVVIPTERGEGTDWDAPFEVDFKDKEIVSIRCLDQGSNGILDSLPLQALLKLVEVLKAEGYTI